VPAPLDRFTTTLESRLVERHTGGTAASVVLRAGPRDWKTALRRVASGHRLLIGVGPDVSVDEVVAHASRKGFTVVDLVPYGGLAGGVLTPGDHPHRWRRVTSWLGVDEQLTALATALEERWIPTLHPSMAAYCLLVADRRPGRDGGDPRHPGPGVLPSRDDQLVRDIEALTTRSLARYFLFLVVDAVAARVPHFDPAVLLTPRRRDEYAAWHEVQQIDEDVTALARQWSAACADRWRDGLDVSVAVDYDLVRELLEQHYGRFEEIER
jgi:hypothetical protein